jgi:hypothetical protein
MNLFYRAQKRAGIVKTSKNTEEKDKSIGKHLSKYKKPLERLKTDF